MSEWIIRGLLCSASGMISPAEAEAFGVEVERWDALRWDDGPKQQAHVVGAPQDRDEIALRLRDYVKSVDAEASFTANDGRFAVPAGNVIRELDSTEFISLMT